jgi:hypothetical protein
MSECMNAATTSSCSCVKVDAEKLDHITSSTVFTNTNSSLQSELEDNNEPLSALWGVCDGQTHHATLGRYRLNAPERDDM